jgi:hypothetical protein
MVVARNGAQDLAIIVLDCCQSLLNLTIQGFHHPVVPTIFCSVNTIKNDNEAVSKQEDVRTEGIRLHCAQRILTANLNCVGRATTFFFSTFAAFRRLT